MRNFPHQVNQISKITGSLRVASELLSRGENIGDDGVFGYAVLRAGIYSFRGASRVSPEELEEAITRERQKPASNQGPRTFARDLRRTLLLLGFIENDARDFSITQSGIRLTELPDPPNEEATSIWVDALINMTLEDTDGHGEYTHPAYNMLRMVAVNPDIEKPWLAFALDMENDSDTELERVLSLQRLNYEDALISVGASYYTAANAVKIIPSLLQQVGLIEIVNQRCRVIIPSVTNFVGIDNRTLTIPQTPRQRNAREGSLITDPEQIPTHQRTPRGERTTEEQVHTAALLDERTTQHQELVKQIVEMLSLSVVVESIRITDDAYDVLAFIPSRDEFLLIEAKTIRNDGMVQGRLALGQLCYYEYFDIRPVAGSSRITKIAVFNQNPGEQVERFLNAYNVLCFTISTEGITIPDDYGDCFIIR